MQAVGREAGRQWSQAEVEQLLNRGLLDLVFEAAQVHREHHSPEQIQCSQLYSVKTGGCPEDCNYCSQSAHYQTPVEREPMAAVDATML